MRVLIIGANGFIGHNLVKRILQTTTWEVCGIDLSSFRLGELMAHPRFSFHAADISKSHEMVEQQVMQSDVVLPLAAVANPMAYVNEPLATFEIVFEENLRIVKLCAKHDVRLIFPSTSEVYGMCADESFNEAESLPTFGPVSKERWIYASSKHLLERVIWSMGHTGLRFTIFRPFNWFGPNLDDINQGQDGGARVVTLFLGRLLRGETIRLVDGGQQARSFTYIDDGIEALMRILSAPDGKADGEIFNIGNPDNLCSIEALARHLARLVGELSCQPDFEKQVQYERIPAKTYFGDAYQDVSRRKPDVARIATQLGWAPAVPLEEALRRTVQWHFSERSAPLSAENISEAEARATCVAI